MLYIDSSTKTPDFTSRLATLDKASALSAWPAAGTLLTLNQPSRLR